MLVCLWLLNPPVSEITGSVAEFGKKLKDVFITIGKYLRFLTDQPLYLEDADPLKLTAAAHALAFRRSNNANETRIRWECESGFDH